jgi:hypothetical protein
VDRFIIYDQAQNRDYDILHGDRRALYGLGQAALDLLGSSGTVIAGLGATAPGALTINLAAGDIYQLAAVDSSAYGSIAADATQTMQQGYALAQSVTLSTTGISSGQSRYTLIQATFSQTDDIPSDDPNGGILNYLNATNPSGPPWSGPSNSGAAQNTRRKGVCVISTVNGAPATTGSEVPPNPSGGNVPLYLVDLAFGQSVITLAQILVAGPSVGVGVPSNYPEAPFLAGLAQKPTYSVFAGNPNGNVAGTAVGTAGTTTAPNIIYDITNKVEWICLTSGSALTAVWVNPAIGTIGQTQLGAYLNKFYNATCMVAQRTGSITVAAGTTAYTLDGYIVGCSGASVTVTQAGSIGLAPNSIQITGQAGVTDVFVIKPIESLDAFGLASNSVAFQVRCLNNSGGSITPTETVKTALSGTDNWATSTLVRNGISLLVNGAAGSLANSANGVLSDIFAMPSSAQQGVSVRVDFGGALNGAGKNVQLGDWDIRVATAILKPELRSFSAEMLQCQRYLPGLAPKSQGNAGPGGTVVTNTAAGVTIEYYTPVRGTTPTALQLSAVADWGLNIAGSPTEITSMAFNGSTSTSGSLNIGGAGGALNTSMTPALGGFGISQGSTNLITINTNAWLVLTGCELNGAAI